MIIDLILFGMLLVMGLYHLTVFLFRKQEMSLVYFSAFCLLVAVYLLTTGEVYFSRSFPARSWEALMVLVFLPIYLGAAVFSSFMRALFIEEFGPWPHRAFTALGIVFSAAVLVLPARVHSQALPVFHAVLAALCAWSLYAIIRAIVNGRNNAWVFLAGVTAMIVAVANDILYYQNVVRTFDMAPFGVVALIFSQAVVLSRGFTEAHASAGRRARKTSTSGRSSGAPRWPGAATASARRPRSVSTGPWPTSGNVTARNFPARGPPPRSTCIPTPSAASSGSTRESAWASISTNSGCAKPPGSSGRGMIPSWTSRFSWDRKPAHLQPGLQVGDENHRRGMAEE